MISTILIFLAVLSILVIAHEFGHFYAARYFGMTVHEFGLGFPPKIFSWTDKQGTEWSLNLIPLGGFVRIKGENGDDQAASEPDSFSSKSKFARFIVLIGGVTMNVILAGFLLSLAYGFAGQQIIPQQESYPTFSKVHSEQVTIIATSPDLPIAETDINPNQTLISINEIEVNSAEQARDLLSTEASELSSISITVLDQDHTHEIIIEPGFLEDSETPIYGLSIADTATVSFPWWSWLLRGFTDAILFLFLIIGAFFKLIIDLITGSGVNEAVAGPVGIAKMTGEVASYGFSHLLNFAALLSLNLAVINALPLPALDGGRILFVFIEAIRGKKNSPQLEAAIHGSGFLLLMILVVIITYRDIVNLL